MCWTDSHDTLVSQCFGRKNSLEKAAEALLLLLNDALAPLPLILCETRENVLSRVPVIGLYEILSVVVLH